MLQLLDQLLVPLQPLGNGLEGRRKDLAEAKPHASAEMERKNMGGSSVFGGALLGRL